MRSLGLYLGGFHRPPFLMAFLAPAAPRSGLFFSTRPRNLRSAAQASLYSSPSTFGEIGVTPTIGDPSPERAQDRSQIPRRSGHRAADRPPFRLLAAGKLWTVGNRISRHASRGGA